MLSKKQAASLRGRRKQHLLESFRPRWLANSDCSWIIQEHSRNSLCAFAPPFSGTSRAISSETFKKWFRGLLQWDYGGLWLQDTPTPGHPNSRTSQPQWGKLRIVSASFTVSFKDWITLISFQVYLFCEYFAAYMSVCHVQVWCPWMSEEGIRSPATEVTDVVSHHGVLWTELVLLGEL